MNEIDIGIGLCNFGILLYGMSMFFGLCEPLNKHFPIGVWGGFIMVIAGGILSGEVHL